MRRDSGQADATYGIESSPDAVPSEAVVAAVAEATDRSPLELDPLIEAVDPDALDSLFARAEAVDSPISLSFVYAGRSVTVTPEGVQVEDAAADGE